MGLLNHRDQPFEWGMLIGAGAGACFAGLVFDTVEIILVGFGAMGIGTFFLNEAVKSGRKRKEESDT
jgi:hypothetical protein